jgi:hypothetical protein
MSQLALQAIARPNSFDKEMEEMAKYFNKQ